LHSFQQEKFQKLPGKKKLDKICTSVYSDISDLYDLYDFLEIEILEA